MPDLERNRQLQRRRALFILFAIPGFGIATWVTRIPAIRDLLGASTASMGVILFGLSAGAMIGIIGSGPLVLRWGTQRIILVGYTGIIASMPIIGLGAMAGSAQVVVAGLFLFGLGVGTSEVAMNVDGTDVEQQLGQSVVPALHGFFSLGKVLGAALGIVFTAVNFSVAVHLIGSGILAFIGFAFAFRYIPPGVGKQGSVPAQPQSEEKPSTTASVETVTADPKGKTKRPIHGQGKIWRDPILWGMAVITLGMSLAEGSATDWLALLMVDGHGLSSSWASASYALFAIGLMSGRFAGTWLVSRYGRPLTLRISTLVGVFGLGLVLFVNQPMIAVISVVLWGLGASLGFPLTISAAGESGAHATKRVSLVVTIGYMAFLVGPPFLGFLGEQVGLRSALIVVMALMSITFFVAGVTKSRLRSSPSTPVHSEKDTCRKE